MKTSVADKSISSSITVLDATLYQAAKGLRTLVISALLLSGCGSKAEDLPPQRDGAISSRIDLPNLLDKEPSDGTNVLDASIEHDIPSKSDVATDLIRLDTIVDQLETGDILEEGENRDLPLNDTSNDQPDADTEDVNIIVDADAALLDAPDLSTLDVPDIEEMDSDVLDATDASLPLDSVTPGDATNSDSPQDITSDSDAGTISPQCFFRKVIHFPNGVRSGASGETAITSNSPTNRVVLDGGTFSTDQCFPIEGTSFTATTAVSIAADVRNNQGVPGVIVGNVVWINRIIFASRFTGNDAALPNSSYLPINSPGVFCITDVIVPTITTDAGISNNRWTVAGGFLADGGVRPIQANGVNCGEVYATANYR